MIGIGGGLAALAMIKIKATATGPAMAGAILAVGAGAAIATIGTSTAIACIGLVIFGVGIVVWGVLARSFEQRAVAPHVTGRFFAYVQGIGGIAVPIGFALTGLALEVLTSETMLRIVSAATVIAAACALHASRTRSAKPGAEVSESANATADT